MAEKVSPDEMKLLQAIRIMGLEPKLESPDDIVKLTKVFTGAKSGSHKDVDDKPPPKHQYPKFSIFYGEENKGEVCWDTLRFEIKSSRIFLIVNSSSITYPRIVSFWPGLPELDSLVAC